MTRPELPTVPDGPRMYRGVDISAWQRPESIDWGALSELCDFVVCRATYGTRRDSRVERHVERVRRNALSLALYHFHRPHQDPQAQADAFFAVDEAVGYEPGDCAPWLDIEDDPGAPAAMREVSPDWSAHAHELCRLLVEQYGETLVYINTSDFLALGQPSWLFDRPLAIAHWTSKPEPMVPKGAEWVAWQRLVAPMEGVSKLPIDQDVAKRLIHIPHPGPLGLTRGELRKVMGDIALTASTTLDEFFRSNRQ